MEALMLIGTELDKRNGAPVALFARQSEEGLSYVCGASSPLKGPHLGALRRINTRSSFGGRDQLGK
jgi:hypothetical protein